MGLGDVAPALLLLKQTPGLAHGQGLVEEGQATAQIVLPQMGEQDIHLLGPGTVKAVHPGKTLVTGLGVEFTEDAQPGIATGLQHVR